MGFQLQSTASWQHNLATNVSETLYFKPLLRLMATSVEALLADSSETGSGAQATGQWVASNASVAGPFSAICWLAGARMLAESNPPGMAIGLIQAAVGGTPVQFWASADTVSRCAVAVANNETVGAGSLYQQYVAPLGPFGLRGVLWDQGEQNMNTPNPHHNIAHHEGSGQVLADAYACMVTALVNQWRTQFRSPTLAFVYVELCMVDMWYEVGHMAFWLAQRSVMKLPGVGFATTTDMCVNSPIDWCFFNLAIVA